jgi:hypothetical protein
MLLPGLCNRATQRSKVIDSRSGKLQLNSGARECITGARRVTAAGGLFGPSELCPKGFPRARGIERVCSATLALVLGGRRSSTGRAALTSEPTEKRSWIQKPAVGPRQRNALSDRIDLFSSDLANMPSVPA